MALGLGGPIGIDAAEIGQIPDWDFVASTYLGTGALKRLRNSPQPSLDFAREWTGFEARLKMDERPLAEGIEPASAVLFEACFGTVIVTVALPG